MKQILQNIRTGETKLETLPPPMVQPGFAKVRMHASLISAGTEKMMIDLAKKSLIGKARARPDLLRQVVSKARKEGITATIRNVLSRLENSIPLGYSGAGVVEELGPGLTALSVGDRVALAGAGYANHAEVNVVPANLVVLIPKNVSMVEACYATVGRIALQGVRLAQPQIGEHVAVIGLGLLGLLTIQILKANGCRVVGIDLERTKVDLAIKLGLDEGIVASEAEVAQAVKGFSQGRGTDITIITAATKSNDPITTAGVITRRKGRVVVVGAVGLDIPRDIYYKKELDIQLSMSYGPGRYDPTYEEGGIDYPYDYVRWTEQRNLSAFLEIISSGKLDVKSLTTHQIPFENALTAYEMIDSDEESYVGIVLTYDADLEHSSVISIDSPRSVQSRETLNIGFVGGGNYADIHLLPNLKSDKNVNLVGLMSATGASAQQKAKKYGFSYCTTEADDVMADENLDAVFVATRHQTHSKYIIQALKEGKHIFVEKPLVVTPQELQTVTETYWECQENQATCLMVGLNRRFAPLVLELKRAFRQNSVLQMIYRVNSGHIPVDTWLHDPKEGGGMLIGEMCHFVDLMQFLAEERPIRVYAQSLVTRQADTNDSDNLILTISFDGGSVGTLCYNTVGDKAGSKERLEVYGGGTVAILDDFRILEITSSGKRRKVKSNNQDKGQRAQLIETVNAMRGKTPVPIPFAELESGMKVIFAARESITTGDPVKLSFTRKDHSFDAQ